MLFGQLWPTWACMLVCVPYTYWALPGLHAGVHTLLVTGLHVGVRTLLQVGLLLVCVPYFEWHRMLTGKLLQAEVRADPWASGAAPATDLERFMAAATPLLHANNARQLTLVRTTLITSVCI